MKSFSFSLASLLTLSASFAASQDFNVSAPFTLVLLSSNATLNGTALVACHEGAAIEGLCAVTTFDLGTTTGSLFNLNTTDNGLPPNLTIGTPGILTYELQGGNFNVSEPMALSYSPTSNVALPLFQPGFTATYVAFDGVGNMNIQAFLDDTTNPATEESSAVPYYRWYVCTTVTAYSYQTLAWAMGEVGIPENLTCQKVQVKQVFAC